jgi:hypothetical protein
MILSLSKSHFQSQIIFNKSKSNQITTVKIMISHGVPDSAVKLITSLSFIQIQQHELYAGANQTAL